MTAKISPADVKKLRETTGAGMMECKKALVEAEGDMQKAEEIIEKSGHKKAAKKASRTTAEGVLLAKVSPDNQSAVLIEVNCETDFVARDDNFKTFCDKLLVTVLENKTADLAKIHELPFDGKMTVEEARQALIAKIGENIQVRRAVYRSIDNGVLGVYCHDNRIGVLVDVENGTPELAKDMALQVAGMKPEYIKPEDLPQEVVEKQKEIFMARAQESGKPQDLIEKMVMGQVNKYLAEICLVGQPFIKDQDKKISQVLKEHNANVRYMTRLEVGEGIEVEKKSFQEEVMEQARGN